MAYTKVHDPWEDAPSTDTPITAAALDTIEEGIDSAWAEIDSMLAGGVAGVDYKGTYNPATAYGKGDVVLYNGVEYVAVNDSTGQTPVAIAASGALPVVGMGLAFPASPFDGQEYILVDSLTAPTYSWRFRYVAAKATNKWVFVGGAPLFAEVIPNEVVSSATYVALATPGPSITIPVAGLYEVRLGSRLAMTTATNVIFHSYDIGPVGAIDADALSFAAPGNYGVANCMRAQRKSIGAGMALVSKYRTSAGTLGIQDRWISALPVAVGG